MKLLSKVNSIPPGLFFWLWISTPTITSSDVAIDLKFGILLVHDKKRKILGKRFDDIIQFLNGIVENAKFGLKSNCPYLLKDEPL